MALMNQPTFNWRPLSRRQIKVFSWWTDDSPYRDYDGIIADGAIRSGKTVSMGASFVFWAMERFNDQNFAICGKTIKSVRRNVVSVLKSILAARGYDVSDNLSDNMLTIRRGSATNRFHLFGGRDERSQDLIQGITLAGILLDEVALMPESFVNQATGRCSVEGSKFWFNCNPEGPAHYFNREWIIRHKDKRLVYLHFTMDDNPSLSEPMKQRYRAMYSGVFFRRFVLGLWAIAEGAIYPMFDKTRHVVRELPKMRRTWVCVDYGHTNPTVFLHLGEDDKRRMYVMREWVHAGSENGAMSPRQYSLEMRKFLNGMDEGDKDLQFDGVFVDPSAEGFINQIREDGIPHVRKADNRVLPGIQLVSSLVASGRLLVHESCATTIREFQSYAWDEKGKERGEDKPVKKNDHCMDALRYGVMADKLVWKRRLANGNGSMAPD